MKNFIPLVLKYLLNLSTCSNYFISLRKVNGSFVTGQIINVKILLKLKIAFCNFHQFLFLQRWEDVWLVESRMIWFPLLFASRDVIVRASAFQLASGLTSSRAGAEFMLTAVDGLWSTSLGVLINHREASVVRENAGMICSNIISHGTKEVSSFTYFFLADLDERIGELSVEQNEQFKIFYL